MDAEIRYLDLLEEDLRDAAAYEAHGGDDGGRGQGGGRGGRGGHRKWTKWVGAAAAVVVVAWAIGSVANGDLSRLLPSGAESAAGSVEARDDRAAEAGDDEFRAVGLSVEGNGLGLEAATPAPSPAPRQGDSAAPLTKIIRSGGVSVLIERDTFDTAFEDVVTIAEDAGGYVLSSSTQGPGSGALVLRIPARSFDQALIAVRGLGEVTGSKVQGQDVTAEFVDTNARLVILKSRRDILLDLMTQAQTIKDTLTVANALDSVQTKIEQYQGQLRFLNDQVAESTLKVELRERGVPENTTEETIDNPSLGRALERSVQGFFGVLATAIVGLGYLLPLGVIAGIGWGVLTLVRRRRREAS